ncbi:MAG: hemolysin family protein, partial [Gemmatimonadaceae bacterium]
MVLAWLAVLLSSLVAGACAAADGAMLTLDPDSPLSPEMRALHGRRERAHRALAFARVMAQLSAGVSVALALQLQGKTPAEDLVLRLVSVVVLVGVSESLARSYGSVAGELILRRLLKFIHFVETILAPVASLGGWIDGALNRLLPPPARDVENREATAEQFRQVVAAEADVSKTQEILLTGVFRIGDTEVQALMIPRVDIEAIDRDTPWSEVVDRFRSTEHARLPVFGESIDDIVGVLFAKDILPIIVADEVPDDWTQQLRPAIFIPATKKADELLRDFQASGSHIAIVADEFGGTAGLITIEDVLEEIVGDIRDETDEEEPVVDREGDERFWVSARLTLDELDELLGTSLKRDDVSTVGGLVYELLGRVPRAGEELAVSGFRVVVERVLRRRVQRVYFERLAAHEPTE